MRTGRHRRWRITAAAALIIMMSGGALVAQQSSLAALPEEPPEVVLYRLGPVLVDPKLSIPEIGRDSNIFNDANAPQDDFVINLQPEVDFFTDLGVLRVAVKSGSTFTYFHENDSERSIAEQVRGRVTARLSRFRPWAGGASVRSNERTSEIDARARRVEREVAAGVEFDLSPLATLSVSGNRMNVRYADRERYRDAVLAESLDRTTDMAAAALRFRATPFTTLTFRGYTSRDAFELDPARDARAQGGELEVQFAPEAVIRGRLGVGFRRQDFDDPALTTFQGITARGGITTLLVWRAILGVDYVRDVQYSYDRREGYYVEDGADVVYTQRIGGPFDIQGRVSRHALDYGARTGIGKTETVWSYHGGVGYSLDGGSRFGVSYEIAERQGGDLERDFERRRLFGSFTYEFWK
jgi:hypothetical protein